MTSATTINARSSSTPTTSPIGLGADGCPGGLWVLARIQGTSAPSIRIDVSTATTDQLITAARAADLTLVDIPIGLPDVGPRACDREARERLGPRRASVFPAPERYLLPFGPDSAREADAAKAARSPSGLAPKVQRQVLNIIPRIREIDDVLRGPARDLADARRLRECHPELCFATLAGQTLDASKHTPEGLSLRRRILRGILPRIDATIDANLDGLHRAGVKPDDLLDALVAGAAAWLIAIDPARAIVLPTVGPGERDAVGLPMEMVAARR